MPRLAFFTFAILRAPRQHPDSAPFLAAIDPTNAAAERAEGFLDQSRVDPDTGRHSWGEPVLPSFVAPDDAPQVTRSLSLWQDLETVFAYAYGGQHAESLRQRKAWFRPPEWPSYVAWWVDDTHQPTWDEAVTKLERLHAMGSTPAAFTFKQAFDAEGRPTEVERHRVKRIVEANSGDE